MLLSLQLTEESRQILFAGAALARCYIGGLIDMTDPASLLLIEPLEKLNLHSDRHACPDQTGRRVLSAVMGDALMEMSCAEAGEQDAVIVRHR